MNNQKPTREIREILESKKENYLHFLSRLEDKEEECAELIYFYLGKNGNWSKKIRELYVEKHFSQINSKFVVEKLKRIEKAIKQTDINLCSNFCPLD